MKVQVRQCTFETNSSSTHSLVMTDKGTFDRWRNGELFLYDGFGYGYHNASKKPITNHFYTPDEIGFFLSINDNFHGNLRNIFNNKFEMAEIFKKEDFITYISYFGDDEDESDYSGLEEFYEEYTTSLGETVVAFGKYGYDS